jgi:aspartyl-tRNA(Asn)/glutamyl-tRNA(Gln) amidotransferase subunit A
VDSLPNGQQDLLNKWQDVVTGLAATVNDTVGLVSLPLTQALYATAQSEETLDHPSRDDQTPVGWQDWWDKRAQLVAGEVSAQDLAQQSLVKLAKVDEATHACVALTAELGLAQAKAIDQKIARGESIGLLGGMPLAHKDLLHRQGHEVGYGMGQARASVCDATVLNRFDSAGALHLARLHMTELAFDPSGTNEMAGSCRNPWDVDRVPGGSSSGSAAVVAAGAVEGALGSDTGGSIRIPAALCGVTGLKPTFGLVSRAGAMSLSSSHDHLGPIARSARDCALMLQAIAGVDGADAGSLAAPYLGRYLDGLEASVAGVRIGVAQGYFSEGLDPRVAAARDQNLAVFQSLGAEVREVPDFPYADVNELAVLMIRAEATALYQDLMKKESKTQLGRFTRARLEEGVSIPGSLYLQAAALRGPMLLQFARTVLADVDVLLAPVFAIETPKIQQFDVMDDTSRRLRGELTRLTRPLNYLGLPALSLPGGALRAEESGIEMPVGFQLIGRPYSESLLLRLGHAFQSSTSWHLRRPGVLVKA